MVTMAPVAGNSGAPPLGELQVSAIPEASRARARRLPTRVSRSATPRAPIRRRSDSRACRLSLTPPFPPSPSTQFSADFEGGNLGDVRRVADNEYELTVRHDTNNPRHRLWFYFKVTNARAGQRVLIHMVNFSKTKSLYRDGMSPLVRSSSSATWERIHPKSVFYYKQKDRPTKRRDDAAAVEDDGRDSPEDGGEGGKKTPCVLSIVYTFDTKEAHWFSYSYPFGYTTQQHILDALERRRLPYVKRELLCRTLQNRRCDVLTIGDDVSDAAGAATDAATDAGAAPCPPAASVTRDGRRRSVVMITCRVHPGETPCSHTLRGFIDFVTGDSPAAVKLRERVTFVVVPMLNPDGCALGNYRTDSMGVDLNRAWRNADAKSKGEWVGTGTFAEHKAAEKKTEQFPTLRHAMALARKYANSDTHALEFYIDIHAHSTSKSSFFFVNNPHDEDDVERWERIAALPKLMDHNCAALEAPGFSLSSCRFCSNPDKAGAGRRAIGDMSRAAHVKRHGAGSSRANRGEEDKSSEDKSEEDKSSPAMCYTLEMSFYNAPSRSRQWSTSTSNEEAYERHGVGLAHAFVDYYRLRPPTEQRVEGILRRVDASAKVPRGSDQAAAWTKGDLMFGFGTQIFADGGGAQKPWHKNGAKEARAALNAREPSFLRWIAQRSAMTPKNVTSSPSSPTSSVPPNASKTLGAKSPDKTPSSGKKATSSVGKHRRNGSPAGTGAKKGSSPSSGAGAGKGKEGGGGKSPGIEPTAFEFVAIPTAPAPTRDANLAGKRGVGRAKLRARRNAPTPSPEPAADDDDDGGDGPSTETGQPAARDRDRALRIPSTISPFQTPGDVDAVADESYGLAADLARARVDVVGTFVPRSDGTDGESPGPLVGSSAIAASVGGVSVGVAGGSAEPSRRARPAPRPPPMYPWEEDVDRFGGVSADVRRLRSA